MAASAMVKRVANAAGQVQLEIAEDLLRGVKNIAKVVNDDVRSTNHQLIGCRDCSKPSMTWSSSSRARRTRTTWPHWDCRQPPIPAALRNGPRTSTNTSRTGTSIRPRFQVPLNPPWEVDEPLPAPSGGRIFVSGFCRFPCVLLQCTHTESPQTTTTLNCHQYVKGTSRGDNGVAAGLADSERAVCRVAHLGHERG